MNQIGRAILLAIVENSILQEKSFIVGSKVWALFFRDVHVVLFSFLADQLSGQFLIFFGQPKKNWLVSETGQFFLSTLLNFLSGIFWKLVTL